MTTDHGDARPSAWLFSYGTLRQPGVQAAVFGRALEMVDDALPDARLEPLPIADPHVVALSGSDVHPVLRRDPGGGRVAGAALAVTADDLARADAYEVADYTRVEVTLASGRRAYAYVHRDDLDAFAGERP